MEVSDRSVLLTSSGPLNPTFPDIQEVLSHRSPLFAHTMSSSEPFAPRHPPPYALYPYTSSSPLPWTMGASSGFRPRRVGEWMLGHKVGTVQSLDGEGSIVSTDGYALSTCYDWLNNSGPLAIVHQFLTLGPPYWARGLYQVILGYFRSLRRGCMFFFVPIMSVLTSSGCPDLDM